MGLLSFFVPSLAYRRAAKRHLPSHFPGREDEVWRSIRVWRKELEPGHPHHTASVNLMMRHMEWGYALYRSLQHHGMDQGEAGSLVEVMMSEVYRPVPATLFRLSRLRSRDHATRVTWLLRRVVSRHVFSAPFVHRHLETDEGVAWDVTCCPFADYFHEHGVPELTPHAACNLDHRAAEVFGVELVRTQTITSGDEYCDFRWKIPA